MSDETVAVVDLEGHVVSQRYEAAARAISLAGVTLGVLDNAKPNADVLLDSVAQRLMADHGVARVVRFSKNSSGVGATESQIIGLATECQVVLTGSGD